MYTFDDFLTVFKMEFRAKVCADCQFLISVPHLSLFPCLVKPEPALTLHTFLLHQLAPRGALSTEAVGKPHKAVVVERPGSGAHSSWGQHG